MTNIATDNILYDRLGLLKKLLLTTTALEDKAPDTIIKKAVNNNLTLEEVAILLKHKHQLADKLINAAASINKNKFHKAIELYAVSYVSDRCINNCAYCGHSVHMSQKRSRLNADELSRDFTEALQYGAVDLCILAGEHPTVTAEYLASAGKIAKAADKLNTLKRITFNVAPMTVDELGIIRKQLNMPLQFRIFQETYDEEVYKKFHTRGPKANFLFRLNAQERALKAGFDYVGLGALMGLNYHNETYQHFGHDTEILSLVAHAHRIKEISGKLPYSLSIPRIQEVIGSSFVANSVDDKTYLLYHAILKLALPETKLIVTCRETESLRNNLRLFTSIEDQTTRPGVGGNYKKEIHLQNELGDQRTTPQIIDDLKAQGYVPIIGTRDNIQ